MNIATVIHERDAVHAGARARGGPVREVGADHAQVLRCGASARDEDREHASDPAIHLRGRCFAEIDRMTSFPLPAFSNFGLEFATACANRAFTSGRDRIDADGTRRNRVCFPDPFRSFVGSRSLAPWMKHTPTPFFAAAMDTMASDGRSVGEYPITKKL